MKIIITSVLLILTMAMSNANDSISTLQYLVRAPKVKSEKPPVIILLHGLGSNEKDLFSFADYLPGNFLVVSLQAPYSMGRDSYAWYEVDFSSGKPVYNKDQELKSRNGIIQFINQLKTKYSFDEKQVYLCGFSQGAIMSYTIGLTRPDLVKGIALMSGRLLEEIKPSVVSNDKLKDLNIFISHGTKDNVLNISYARESLAYLKTKGLIPVYNEYVEGHSINNQMFTDLVKWLGE